MNTSSTIQDASFLLPIVTGVVALIASFVGVLGAHLVQRYNLSASRIRDKYAFLRKAYSSFFAANHTFVGVCRAHSVNSVGFRKAVKNNLFPFAKKNNATLTDAARDEISEQIKQAVRGDIVQRRRMNLALNEQQSAAALEIHRTYARLIMLDNDLERLNQVKDLYSKCQKTPAIFSEAISNQEMDILAVIASLDASANTILSGIDKWIINVGRKLDEEEKVELNKLGFIRLLFTGLW